MNINIGRLIVSFIIVLIFIYLFEWIFQGFYLRELFAKAELQILQPQVDLGANFMGIIASQALFALIFCLIYARIGCKRHIYEGIMYGLMIGLLLAGPYYIIYTRHPNIPTLLVMKWIAGAVIEMVCAGVILSLIYKPKERIKTINEL